MPHQHALSTKAGTEALVRHLRAATELDPRATILSVDGVGAYRSCPAMPCPSTYRVLGVLRRHPPGPPPSIPWRHQPDPASPCSRPPIILEANQACSKHPPRRRIRRAGLGHPRSPHPAHPAPTRGKQENTNEGGNASQAQQPTTMRPPRFMFLSDLHLSSRALLLLQASPSAQQAQKYTLSSQHFRRVRLPSEPSQLAARLSHDRGLGERLAPVEPRWQWTPPWSARWKRRTAPPRLWARQQAASAWSSRWASLAAVAARAHAASLLELPLHGEDAMDAPPCSCLDPMWI